jgi:hypothetical protein
MPQSGKKIIINFGTTEVRLKAGSDSIAEQWVAGLQSAMQCSLKLNEQSKLLTLAKVWHSLRAWGGLLLLACMGWAVVL